MQVWHKCSSKCVVMWSRSVKCQVCCKIVRCQVRSMKCKVKSLGCEVLSMKNSFWTIKCKVWSMKWEICIYREVLSVKKNSCWNVLQLDYPDSPINQYRETLSSISISLSRCGYLICFGQLIENMSSSLGLKFYSKAVTDR